MKRNNVICLICHGQSDKYLTVTDMLYGFDGEWDLFKCNNNDCGHIFQFPVPNDTDLVKYYSDEYYSASPPQIDFDPAYNKNRGVWLKLNYLKYFLGYKHLSQCNFPPAALLGKYLLSKPMNYDTPNFIKNGKILDFGSGSGDSVSFLNYIGWDSEGIDFSKSAVEAGKKSKLKIKQGSIEELDKMVDYYDYIISSHCVEHVPDIYRLFNSFYNALKIGGTLAIEVPNGDSLSFKILKKYYYYLAIPLHVHIFSIKSLLFIAKKTGFKNIEFSSYNNISKQAASFELIYRKSKNKIFLSSRDKIKIRYYLIALLKTYSFNSSKGDCLVMKMSK